MTQHRTVRQQLEDWRRAGVTHVPADAAKALLELTHPGNANSTTTSRSSVARPTTSNVASQTSNRTASSVSNAASANARPAASAATRSTPSPVAENTAVSKPQSSAAVTAPKPAAEATPAAGATQRTPYVSRGPVAPIAVAAGGAELNAAIRPGCQLSRDERIAQLDGVKARVAACKLCDELARTRTQTVFGTGNPEATTMFIGEAPGADEDAKGEPFVGEAGKLLTKIITAMKLSRDEVYICNILRCRPPGNRVPTLQEANHCREFLEAQITTINPQWIVCLGAVAAQNLLNTTAAIGKLRGVFHDYKGIKVLCTYHPSYLLRYEPAKKDVWTDMKMLRAAQGVILQ